MSAGSKLCSIFELVENVLIYLDFFDLTKCRQVSRFWNQTIQRSQALRQTLLLDPMSTEPHRIFYTSQNMWQWRGLPTYDYTAHFTEFAALRSTNPQPWSVLPSPSQDQEFTVATVCPALRGIDAANQWRDSTGEVQPKPFKTQLQISFPTLKRMFSWPTSGLWQQIFLTQPPCTSISVDIGEIGTKGTVIHDMQGVKLGTVVQKLRDLVGSRSQFWICEPMYWPSSVGSYIKKPYLVIGTVPGMVAETSPWVEQAEQELEAHRQAQERAFQNHLDELACDKDGEGENVESENAGQESVEMKTGEGETNHEDMQIENTTEQHVEEPADDDGENRLDRLKLE